MEKETKIILESLRMLLWENWRKWDRISRENLGGGDCVETNEIVEQVKEINKLLNPPKQTLVEDRTKDMFAEQKESEVKKC